MEHMHHAMEGKKGMPPQPMDEDRDIADAHVADTDEDLKEGIVPQGTDSDLHADAEEPEDNHEGGEDHDASLKKVIRRDLM